MKKTIDQVPPLSRYSWFGLLLATFSVSLAQQPSLRFDHNWGPLAKVAGYSSMLQDHKGLLWFGSTKYDGNRLTRYQSAPFDSTSIAASGVYAQWEDPTGLIWLGTSESTCRFDPRTEKFTRLVRGPANPYAIGQLTAINQDREGNIWAAGDGELRRVNPKTGRYSATSYASMLGLDSRSTRKQPVSVIYRDKGGTLWLGSRFTGLHRLILTGRPSKVSFAHYSHDETNASSLSDNEVTSIYEDHNGVLWVGCGPADNFSPVSKGGLNAFDPRTGRFTRYVYDPQNHSSLSNNAVTSITEDPQGRLWVGTRSGLNQLNPQRTAFTPYLNDPLNGTSLQHNHIYGLLMEPSGILWVKTLTGIDKLDLHQKPFALYRHNPSDANSLSHNAVSALVEDEEGTLWIGTLGGGLNAWNKKTNQFTQYGHEAHNPHSLVNDRVSALVQDSQHNLWVANGEVLSRLDKQTGRFTHFPLKHPFISGNNAPAPVFTLVSGQEGWLWVGTTNGIIQFNPQTGAMRSYIRTPDSTEGMSDYWTLALLEDRKGYLWVGHGSKALDKLDPRTGKVTRYQHDSRNPHSLSSNSVKCFHQDVTGTLWIGNDNGLSQFNPTTGRFTNFTQQHGLAGNTVYSILEDNEGNLWLGTDHGLSRFSISRHTFTNYDRNDGLQSDLFTTDYVGGARCRGRDGTLYFGGENGFNAFDPTAIRPNSYVPPVVITQFSLFDKSLPGKHELPLIDLDYDQNFFSLEFAALNYSSPHKNQYAYQLEGVDKDWVYSGTRHVSAYTDVAPGGYVFRVKGSNNDGVWNKKGTSLRILIHPPWWRTWWAYALYALLFVAGVWAFIAYRSRALRQENRLLEEKVALRTDQLERKSHELEHSLDHLKATQTQLIQKEKMASLGELTAGIAHEIQNPLNFVNNFSEVSTELVDELKEGPFQKLPDSEKEYANEILGDLTQNLEKITHHGQRASSIVKGMLEHSRTATGERQPTDLNKLVDEYLRLAYQGMRAKDRTGSPDSFNCKLITDLDPALGLVEVVPQEIGRVLLNLYNNAFYATQQRQKEGQPDYKATVRVSTRFVPQSPERAASLATLTGVGTNGTRESIEIRVRDNGTGIPESVKDKIFQPFFTTKPTGEGTGLGLSLSYDIVTKGHGGTLTVESMEREGKEFVVSLPLKTNL
jgi:signal transduction histidine kinase/ligand-binding sensor domain-containing protein